MKKFIFIIAAFLLTTTNLFSQTKAGKVDTAQHVSYYSCPKHPEVTSHQPGKCPKCGMELTLTTKEQLKASVTKTYRCPIHIDVFSHHPGKCPQCGRKMNLSPKEQMKAEVMKLYTCPMHPDVALDKEGKCPKCGATLVEKKSSN